MQKEKPPAPPLPPNSNGEKGFTTKLDAHMGLRGIVSGIITFSHGLASTKYATDLQTSALMPLFFLLSGFSLAIIYGARPLKLICSASHMGVVEDVDKCPAIIKTEVVDDDHCKPFDIRRFYWKRFARAMPTY